MFVWFDLPFSSFLSWSCIDKNLAACHLLPSVSVCGRIFERKGMNTVPQWFTIRNLVDAAGIAGFFLSLLLAVSQIWANRLRIRGADCVLVEPHSIPGSVFLYVCLFNRTNLPFSLIDIHINAGPGRRNIPIEKTVRTYASSGNAQKAPVEPVVLSQAFPVRFDSYGAEVFLLEVLRQHIDTKSLHPDEPAHSQAGPRRKQFPQIRKLCRRQPRLRLKLRTSRGRFSVTVRIGSVQGWAWLEAYAVQKAGHEGKILFP